MQTPARDYNKFFYPSLCHVCKGRNQKNLTSCSDCLMISYCSEMHRLQHRAQHTEICKAIVKLDITKNLWTTCGMTNDEWVTYIKKNLNDIRQVLCRELEPYEKQMFLFAKSCDICHQQQMTKLACHECFHIYKCNIHMPIPVIHDCDQLKIALYLDIYEFMEKQDEGIPSDQLPKTMNEILENPCIEAIIQRYKWGGQLQPKWKFEDYIFSNSISGPLTLCPLISLNIKQKKKTFVIHIIAGCLTDKQSLSAWEIVLHMLAPGTNLKIIMIKPELEKDDSVAWQICKDCHILDRTLCFELYGLLYEHYLQSSYYIPPDVIVGFQAKLWILEMSTIQALQRQNCPLLLTCTSYIKALKNIQKLDRNLNLSVKPIINPLNSFRSYRPYRDLEMETSVPNSCSFFYNKLCKT